ncbi:MAG TPA: hypothetical protein DCE56_01895 [Cyanobacteria bacterium UBA8553]|nr:hypothetical protein [Cyanobacteria bacterium UBA8553]
MKFFGIKNIKNYKFTNQRLGSLLIVPKTLAILTEKFFNVQSFKNKDFRDIWIRLGCRDLLKSVTSLASSTAEANRA